MPRRKTPNRTYLVAQEVGRILCDTKELHVSSAPLASDVSVRAEVGCHPVFMLTTNYGREKDLLLIPLDRNGDICVQDLLRAINAKT